MGNNLTGAPPFGANRIRALAPPTPEDFGLLQSDVDSYRSKKASFVSATPWIFVATMAIATCSPFFFPIPFKNQLVDACIFLISAAPMLGLLMVGLGSGVGIVYFALEYPAHRRFEEARERYKQQEIRLRKEFWLGLNGRSFEREITALFRALGYVARLTPTSNDGGVDIFLEKDGKTTVVQCKAHRKPVGPATARELYGAMIAFGAQGAILVCPSGATAGVCTFIRGKPIEVMDLNHILLLQSGLNAN